MNARRVSTIGGVLLAVGLAGFMLGASSGGSDGGSDPSSSSGDPASAGEDAVFARGMELVKDGKYEDARERFEMALKKRKNDPDVLNMLAYTQRKTGHLEDAFENYRKALAGRPKFPQAREYLAEAHLQSVLLQVDVLRGYGPEGQKELDQILSMLRKAAENPTAEAMNASSPSGSSDW
jgi:tetratricopeptide (TPR) repeat protein